MKSTELSCEAHWGVYNQHINSDVDTPAAEDKTMSNPYSSFSDSQIGDEVYRLINKAICQALVNEISDAASIEESEGKTNGWTFRRGVLTVQLDGRQHKTRKLSKQRFQDIVDEGEMLAGGEEWDLLWEESNKRTREQMAARRIEIDAEIERRKRELGLI